MACDDVGMASLGDADLRLKLSASESERRIGKAQRRLLALRLQAGGLIGGRLGPPLCVLFEGWDASAKGGCIRRLVNPLDPRHVRVTQFGAPSSDERRHHFLRRFSAALPGWGGMAVLDRSWYGRVLVERVEGLATEDEWRRAYPLTDAEFAEIRRHPGAGRELLTELGGFRPLVLDLVESHHERLDGRGYPNGLAAGARSTSPSASPRWLTSTTR
jgi:polyphosphate kinase 2 PPK2/HD domain-containing protein